MKHLVLVLAILRNTFSSRQITQVLENYNVRKHRNIKLVATERRRNYLVSDSNYHTKKFFTVKVLIAEMTKTKILMKKPVYF